MAGEVEGHVGAGLALAALGQALGVEHAHGEAVPARHGRVGHGHADEAVGHLGHEEVLAAADVGHGDGRRVGLGGDGVALGVQGRRRGALDDVGHVAAVDGAEPDLDEDARPGDAAGGIVGLGRDEHGVAEVGPAAALLLADGQDALELVEGQRQHVARQRLELQGEVLERGQLGLGGAPDEAVGRAGLQDGHRIDLDERQGQLVVGGEQGRRLDADLRRHDAARLVLQLELVGGGAAGAAVGDADGGVDGPARGLGVVQGLAWGLRPRDGRAAVAAGGDVRLPQRGHGQEGQQQEQRAHGSSGSRR